MAAQGYAATSVADILKRAGVSRTTFYELFDSKLDCFLAACRLATAVVADRMAAELERIEAEGPAAPIDQLDRLLGIYLGTLVDQPDLARVFLVEVYAAGPAAIRQRRDALEQFVDLVAAALGARPGPDGAGGPASSAEDRLVAEVLVAAVSSKATAAVGLGEVEQLAALREPLRRLAGRLVAT